jgi:phage gp36-like protein
MTSYCTAADLSEDLLAVYVAKAEELAPGCVAKAVASANAMVEDHLRARYVLPLAAVPDTLRQIAAVLAAYKVVGAVTTLLEDAPFAYLLDQVREARKSLERIRDGKDDLGLEQLGAQDAPSVETGIEVSAPPRVFGRDTLRRFR